MTVVVNWHSKRIMRECLLASQTPARADAVSEVRVGVMCVIGCGSSGEP